MDEGVLAPGRVSFSIIIFLQHVAEFKHIFEHFTTPVNQSLQKKKDAEAAFKSHEEKDAFTKTTEAQEDEEKKEKQMSKK